MSAPFTLDTSGGVFVDAAVIAGPGARMGYRWSDISPFTQGYIEALFAWNMERLSLEFRVYWEEKGFSDLAPETLARIIADCEARLRHYPSEGETNPFFGTSPHHQLNANGARFWKWRQGGRCKNFPPLTVQLGDDGKVRFAQ